MFLITGADNSLISGLEFSAGIYFGDDPSNQTVNNVRIERCRLENLILGRVYPNTSINRVIRENVINTLIGYISNCTIENNFLRNCNQFDGCTFNHNNFGMYFCWGYGLNYLTNCLLYNNIFINGGCGGFLVNSCFSNFFVNNLFSFDPSFPNGTNDGENNLINIPAIYTYAGWDFQYSNNYHLIAGSPGINYGTDGTDVGIYGNTYPYKDGALPVNPHISTSTIAPHVIQNDGLLNVNQVIEAQTR